MDSGDLNTGPHDSTASTLTTEQFPQLYLVPYLFLNDKILD